MVIDPCCNSILDTVKTVRLDLWVGIDSNNRIQYSFTMITLYCGKGFDTELRLFCRVIYF